ncbi:WD repeat-containing protein 70 [Ilyodon furcidens]|uniref:WD repeat-containing protein 70 n=2 Tax=Goodeidae TaxID=28758 RepID=A0ABV0VGX9_9TELE
MIDSLEFGCVQARNWFGSLTVIALLPWLFGHVVHTKFHCRQAHTPGSDTSCLCFSYDGITLASRGGDDTLKIWDIRNFRKPVNEANRLTNYFSMTDCCFSPDDRLVVTGTSVKKEEGNGKLVFFDRASFQKVYEIDVTNAVSSAAAVPRIRGFIF